MQKRLLIIVLTLLLIIILTLTLHISFVNASPVIFNMDTLPEDEGWTVRKVGKATSSVSNGILTLNNNNGDIVYDAPVDWRNTVNNSKGWIIEFRMKIDPISFAEPHSDSIFLVEIADKSHSLVITFFKDTIRTFGVPRAEYLMDTTDIFHVYRIIGQGDIVQIFIDEKLAINSFNTRPANTFPISFGSHYHDTISYWDYFSYDTMPNVTLTSPTLTVVNGTSSYYISNLTGVTVDNSLIPIPNGTYASWCIDKSVVMIRNEAHNVMLYSSTQYIPEDAIRQYNWSSVNYILNHKQGSMKEIQNAIWYFVPDYTTPPLNETNTWNMINDAKINSNYVPGKGDIMAVIAFAGHYSGTYTSGSGVQNTIIEYRIP